MVNPTPICPECLSSRDTEIRNLRHAIGEGYCWVCDEYFQPIAEVRIEPVDLTAGMDSF